MLGYRLPLLISALLHGAIIVFLVFYKSEPVKSLPLVSQPEKIEIVEAVAVDQRQVEKAIEALRQAELRKQEAERARQRELQRQAEEAKRKREQAKRAAEQERQRQAAEKKRLAELEKQRKAAEEKRKEAERLAKIEKERKEAEAKALAERKRQQEEKARVEAEAKRQRAEKQRKEREEQQRRELLAEEQRQLEAATARYVAGEVEKYKSLILSAISQHWRIPSSANKDLSSILLIRLAPGGLVLDVQLLRSSGDPALDRSAQNAVYNASPLPVPEEAVVFDKFRELRLTVRPENVLTRQS